MRTELHLLVAIIGVASAVKEWGYGNTVFKKSSREPKVAGPLDWEKVNKNCGKAYQSPINIIPDDAEKADFDKFEWEFNNELLGGMVGTLKNDGRALVYTLKNKRNDNDQNIKVSQTTFMPTPFRLHRMKIHFGCDSSQGSEHRIKGKQFAGEIQLTFFDENFGTFQKALKHKKKVVIFSILLKKGGKNRQIARLDEAIQNIREEGKQEKEVEVSIKKMIPQLRANAKFYTYELGSLTIPPCSPNIRWIILKEPLSISGEQLSTLKMLESEHGQTSGQMCNNYRPIQETQGRQIQRNFALY